MITYIEHDFLIPHILELGWMVKGVFQGVEYTDVNTVCRSIS